MTIFDARLHQAREILRREGSHADALNLETELLAAIGAVKTSPQLAAIPQFLEEFESAIWSGWGGATATESGRDFVTALTARRSELSRLPEFEGVVLAAETALGPVTADVQARLSLMGVMLDAYEPANREAAESMKLSGAQVIRAARLPGDVGLIARMFAAGEDYGLPQGVSQAWTRALKDFYATCTAPRLKAALLQRSPGFVDLGDTGLSVN